MAFVVLSQLLSISTLISLVLARIPDDLEPINVYNYSNGYSVFDGTVGGASSNSNGSMFNSLQGMKKIGRSLYVYCRDNIFVVDVDGASGSFIPFKQKIEWSSSVEKINSCKQKGRTAGECKNFIKIFQPEYDRNNPAKKRVIVCGTNAFHPSCRVYNISADGKLLYTKESLLGDELFCSYSPNESAASFFVDNNLYAATVAGFGTADARIVKAHRTNPDVRLRTPRSDMDVLNDPTFIRFIDGGNTLNKIFLFYTETAVEEQNSVNYSRVAQACKDDRGGTNLLRSQFSSFFKARLNCSLPGRPPFYFDEMRDVTDVVTLGSRYKAGNKKLVFAVMNTPENSVRSSAICAFALKDISRAMNGPFLDKFTQKNSKRFHWEKLEYDQEPHLSRCEVDSLDLSNKQLNFIKKHPLMHDSVPSWNLKSFGGFNRESAPVFTRTTAGNFLTSIYVDTEAGPSSSDTVLIAGTEDGKILKILLLSDGVSVLVEERVVFNSRLCRKSSRNVIKIFVDKPSGVMLVAFERCVVRAPLCPLDGSPCLEKCTEARDPYCSRENERCVTLGKSALKKRNVNAIFSQDGQHDFDHRLIECQDAAAGCVLRCDGNQSINHSIATRQHKICHWDWPANATDTCSRAYSCCFKGKYIIGSAVASATTTAIESETIAGGVAFTHEHIFNTLEKEAALSPVILYAILGVALVVLLIICLCLCIALMKTRKASKQSDSSSMYTSTTEGGKAKKEDKKSNQSRNRISSGSSQHNNENNQSQSRADRSRKRTITDNSESSGGDAKADRTPDEATIPTDVWSEDGGPHLAQRQLSNESAKKQARVKSSSSSNRDDQSIHLKERNLSGGSGESRRQATRGANQGYSRQKSNDSGKGPETPTIFQDPYSSSPPSHSQMARAPPNRTYSYQGPRQHQQFSGARSSHTLNAGGSPIWGGLQRQLSLQANNNSRQEFAPVVLSSPRVRPQHSAPFGANQPGRDVVAKPWNKNVDFSRMPGMTRSLDRMKREEESKYSLPPPGSSEERGQPPILPDANNAALRRRYASESDNFARSQASRPPKYNAIDEEGSNDLPPLPQPSNQDSHVPKEKLKLDLPNNYLNDGGTSNSQPHPQKPSLPLKNLLSGPFASHSNPGTPSRDHRFHFPDHVQPTRTAFTPQGNNVQENGLFVIGGNPYDRKTSPTKSNPPTPIRDGRSLTSFSDHEKKRYPSGQNYILAQPSLYSPHFTNPPPAFYATSNGLVQHPSPKRIRNPSGGGAHRGHPVTENGFTATGHHNHVTGPGISRSRDPGIDQSDSRLQSK